MNQLIEDIKQWGRDKSIIGANGKGTLLGQLSKTQEELAETRDAAVLLMAMKRNYPFPPDGGLTEAQLQDGIGDCTVTLILAAEMAGLDFAECVQYAYDEIKGRTGKMENGQFIKDKS